MKIAVKDGVVVASFRNYQTPLKTDFIPPADDIKQVTGVGITIGMADPTIADPGCLERSDADLEEAIDWTTNLPVFATMTSSEALQYVEDNVTDLDSAKALLKHIAKAIVLIRNNTL
jgi:hypothetical protein